MSHVQEIGKINFLAQHGSNLRGSVLRPFDTKLIDKGFSCEKAYDTVQPSRYEYVVQP